MSKRYLPAPRGWMSACIATSLVAGLGACAGAQAAPAKAVKWVVTCPVKPREAARPDAEARVADQAAAALLDAPLHAAAAPRDASSSAPPPAPSSTTDATHTNIVTAAAVVPLLPSLAPQFPPLPPHPQSPPAAAEGAAMAGPAPAAPAATPTAPLVPSTAAVTGSAHTVALQPASLAALAVPVPTAVAAAPVSAAAPAAAQLAPFAIEPQRWEVRTSDVTLAKTLSRWAQEAGYRLQWDAARNFLIGAPSSFVGGFEDAVAQALGTPGVRSSDYPLEACVYANTPPLLRVTRQGEQVRECVAVSP